MSVRRAVFLTSSGLDRFSFETELRPDKPDRVYIVYRDPLTGEPMTTPEGTQFTRCRLFDPQEGQPRYLTCKDGGIHLYFPSCPSRGNVIKYLKRNPDEPVYITEGEKKAAKAWLEGIPCIGLSGIWCWLANKEDRPGEEKILHPDFDLIPDLHQRAVFMVYDSDALIPQKKADFDACSRAFEACLRARGVARYEKIVLPSIEGKRTGLDDYLLEHSVEDFGKLVAEQSTTAPVGQYIMTSRRFLATNFPPIHFIIQPWLMDCGLTMVHAAPGAGKTFFLLAMAAAITRRNPPEDFCGWRIKRAASVFYVDGEMPPFSMQRRLALVQAAYPNNSESKANPLFFLSCMNYTRQTGRQFTFSDENIRNEFLKQMTDHPARIIVLDNIVSLMNTRDENDAGAWSVINQWLLTLRGMGKSVIIVHHSSKTGTQRGTSHRSDNLDTIIRLKGCGDGEMTVVFEKHRNFGSAEAAPVDIDFQVDNDRALFTRAEHEDEETQDKKEGIRKALTDGELQQKRIAEIFKVTPGYISQVKKQMATEDPEE